MVGQSAVVCPAGPKMMTVNFRKLQLLPFKCLPFQKEVLAV